MAVLKKALAEAEDKAAKECAAREKHEARVSEVQQELQDADKKYESLERDSKTQGSEFYGAEEGSSMEKLFWSQYLGTEHLMPLRDQLKQLVELHKVAELAMKDLIVRLWPPSPCPASTSDS